MGVAETIDQNLRGYHLIPASTMNALLNWIIHKHLPGDFVTKVLQNDLKGAFAHGDYSNIRALWAISTWLYNRAPTLCYGSTERMNEWVPFSLHGSEEVAEWRANAIKGTVLEVGEIDPQLCATCFSVKIGGVCRTCSP